MRRRDFLYNTGLLFPALLASPALALASSKTIAADLLIIQNEQVTPAHVSAAFDNLPVSGRRLNGSEISQLTYSKNGFLVTTVHNTTFLAQKIVVQSLHRINSLHSSVEIKTGEKTFHLKYVAENKNRIAPEFWFLKTKHFHANRVTPFINRNKHAVLCMSGS